VANLQIDQFPAAGPLGSTDATLVQQSGVTGQSTPAAIATYVAANLPAGTVTLANLANIAANSVVGNIIGSPAVPTALTSTQLTAFLNPATAALQGAVPASGGGTSNFLRSDFTWHPSGGTVSSVGVTSTDLSVAGSPVTGSSSITLNINANAVTNAKLAQMSANTIKGNNTGSTANAVDLTTTQVAAMLGLSGSAPVFTVSVTASPTTSVNNYSPSGYAGGTTNRLLLAAASGGSTITGLAAATDGWTVLIRNTSTTDILIFPHLSGSSTSTNQFSNMNAGTMNIAPLGAALLVYIVNVWVFV
jgi:hypothetical protein